MVQTRDHPLEVLHVCSHPWKVCKSCGGPELSWGGGAIVGLDLLLGESARNKSGAACTIKWIKTKGKHLYYLYVQNIFQQKENPRDDTVATYQNKLGSCKVIVFSYGCVDCLWGRKCSYHTVTKSTKILILWTFRCWNFTGDIFTFWFGESSFLSGSNVKSMGTFS